MKWAQTDPESCGAASLMVALAEKGVGSVNREQEHELWARIRASGHYRGSLPGLIATEAQRQGVASRIYVDNVRLGQARAAVGSMAAFDVAGMLRQHEDALAAARSAGVAIDEGTMNPDALMQAMREGASILSAFAVPARGGGITLHWRLYRMVGGVMSEMDPAGGVESRKTESEMRDVFTGVSYIGLSVSLRGR